MIKQYGGVTDDNDSYFCSGYLDDGRHLPVRLCRLLWTQVLPCLRSAHGSAGFSGQLTAPLGYQVISRLRRILSSAHGSAGISGPHTAPLGYQVSSRLLWDIRSAHGSTGISGQLTAPLGYQVSSRLRWVLRSVHCSFGF